MKIKAISLSLILLLTLIPNTIHGQSDYPVDQCLVDYDGDYDKINATYIRVFNAWIYSENNVCKWTSAETLIWNDETNSFENYIFVDNYDSLGYYQISNSMVGIRIYDYYNEFWDPDFTEIVINSEIWEVERWRPQGQGSWDSLGAQAEAPLYNVIENNSGLYLQQDFTSWAGWLNITYIIKTDQPLKHLVIFQSLMSELERFRVIQEWAGISASKVNGNTINEGQDINGFKFFFTDEDDNTRVYENQEDMFRVWNDTNQEFEYLENQRLVNSYMELQANGIKSSYYFESWDLNPGELLIIDPVTFTNSTPDDDARINRWAGETNINYDGQDLSAGLYATFTNDWLTLIKWDISSIPDTATITDALAEGNRSSGAGVGTISCQNVTDDSWVEETVTHDNTPPGIAELDTYSLGAPGGYKTICEGAAFDSFVANQLVDNKVSIILNHSIVAGNNYDTYRSKDGGGTTTGFPKLTVEYTLPFFYITAVFFEGISSMAYNTTNLVNDTATSISVDNLAVFDVNITDNYVFYRYELPDSEDNHTHITPYNRIIDANYTISAYALPVGGGPDFSGVTFILLAIVICFTGIIVLVVLRKN
jgi:hypothetical protein